MFVSHSASHGVFTKGLWEEIFCRMYTGTKTDIMNCYFLRSLIKEGYHSVGYEVIFSLGLIADNQDWVYVCVLLSLKDQHCCTDGLKVRLRVLRYSAPDLVKLLKHSKRLTVKIFPQITIKSRVLSSVYIAQMPWYSCQDLTARCYRAFFFFWVTKTSIYTFDMVSALKEFRPCITIYVEVNVLR